MKVGIMTWFHYHNYGTALQVTALSNVIKNMGHEPKVINYIPNSIPVKRYKESIFSQGVKSIVSRIVEHPYHVFRGTEREKKFCEFCEKNLVFTYSCNILPELESLNSILDCFVCGSDQIWAPSVFDSHYYLDYVFDSKKMIAYAPSIGLEMIRDKDVLDQVSILADRFLHISTRERSGSEIIEKLIGRSVETVLDPTMLLDVEAWHEYESQRMDIGKPYILIYMLGHNKRQWKQIYNISEKLGIDVKIIPVFKSDFNRKGCIKSPVGPSEFLELVHNASFVCTDSFHGTIFSIIYHKKFCVFERFKKNDSFSQNSRIYNILNLFHLEDRCIKNGHDISIIYSAIDYGKVDNLLAVERTNSIQYLKSSLAVVDGYNKKVIKAKNHIFHNRTLCCGCGVCQVTCPAHAIEIKLDADGFYHASVDDVQCISCRKCRSACPYLDLSIAESIKQTRLFSYKDTDMAVLLKSSSGGAANRLAVQAIETGYGVCGCRFDRFQHKAEHILTFSRSALADFQGSKYIQSDFSTALKECMKIDKSMVIFGTPCQIAGARRLLKNKIDHILFVDLICHGVPSYHLYKKYLEHLEKNEHMNIDELETIFRYKPNGWRERYIYNGNSQKSICTDQHKDLFFMMFEQGLCYSKACYECPWRDKSAADIRLGDYWDNKYASDKTGVSMVIAVTDKGENWVKKLESEYTGKVKEEPIQDYFNCQQVINHPRPVFWSSVIDDLSSKRELKEIVNEYAIPFEKRSQIRRKMLSFKRVLKRNGD